VLISFILIARNMYMKKEINDKELQKKLNYKKLKMRRISNLFQLLYKSSPRV